MCQGHSPDEFHIVVLISSLSHLLNILSNDADLLLFIKIEC